MRGIILAVVFGLVALSGASAAQTTGDKPESAPVQPPAPPDPAAVIAQLEASVPPARDEDVRSVDAIVGAIYNVLSGPAGERDWNRLRSLMLPEGRFAKSIVDEKGNVVVRRVTIDQYIEGAQPILAAMPFYEHALVNRIQRFGNIAQVFSSYASSHAPNAKPFERGINSMQLLYDGKRWWVSSILWDKERPGNDLPPLMRHAGS